MITIVYGLPGSGKTLYALWAMQVAVRAGLPVTTNIVLTKRCPFESRVVLMDDERFHVYRDSLSDENPGGPHDAFWRYAEPGGLIVIDEFDNYMDCSDFAKLGRVDEARLYFKQHRKRRLDQFPDRRGDNLILIVQSLENMWVRARRMAGRFVRAEATHRSRPFMQYVPRMFWAFVYTEFANEPRSIADRVSEDYIEYDRASAMFSWYETEQVVGGIARFGRAVNA